jgi:DNA-binding winged helix-turn-helix (wHTH) protein
MPFEVGDLLLEAFNAVVQRSEFFSQCWLP